NLSQAVTNLRDPFPDLFLTRIDGLINLAPNLILIGLNLGEFAVRPELKIQSSRLEMPERIENKRFQSANPTTCQRLFDLTLTDLDAEFAVSDGSLLADHFLGICTTGQDHQGEL